MLPSQLGGHLLRVELGCAGQLELGVSPCTTPAPTSPPERWIRLGAHTWILPQQREVDAVVILVLDVDQPASRQRRSGHREGGRGSSQRVELVDEVETEIELGVRLLGLGYARCHFYRKVCSPLANEF